MLFVSSGCRCSRPHAAVKADPHVRRCTSPAQLTPVAPRAGSMSCVHCEGLPSFAKPLGIRRDPNCEPALVRGCARDGLKRGLWISADSARPSEQAEETGGRQEKSQRNLALLGARDIAELQCGGPRFFARIACIAPVQHANARCACAHKGAENSTPLDAIVSIILQATTQPPSTSPTCSCPPASRHPQNTDKV